MKNDLGYFKNYKHLDVIEVRNSFEWNYILIVDIPKKDGTKKRKLFNLSYNGDEVKPEWYDNLNANCFKFNRNLADEAVKDGNDIR